MKRTLIATASAAAVLILAACSSNGGSTGSSDSTSSGPMSSGMSMHASSSPAGAAATGPHNAADVTFATDMIPHHGQAIEMADMALSQATTSEVRTFATEIKAAQAPEIARMSGWLTGWNSPVPDTSMDSSMGGMSMPGMMSAEDMQMLSEATGTAFDKLWVQMMTEHHNGAIDMAKTELAQGQNSQAKSLAQSIITSQSSEVTRLRALLQTLGS